jgi:hypothetical protein
MEYVTEFTKTIFLFMTHPLQLYRRANFVLVEQEDCLTKSIGLTGWFLTQFCGIVDCLQMKLTNFTKLAAAEC